MTKLSERFQELVAPLQDKKKKPGKGEDQSALTSQVVDLILAEAVQERASDIHFEPEESRLKVRYRIDGILQEVLHVENDWNFPVITRLKIMAGLETDAMMKKKSQDGRFSSRFGAGGYDFRVSTFPTVNGEKMAIRILNEDVGLYDLSRIGLDQFDQQRIDRLLKHRHGLVLVSGPTGSGKTTTLYALLNILNSPGTNIVTLEDPVEYKITGMNQCDIKSRSEFQFSDGLKAVLRQDPDVILVGEIRDRDTADIAIRAAITGHVVFSSLHANNAIGTVVRLINMGLEPFMVSYAMIGAMAQRLVRRVCDECKNPYTVGPDELKQLRQFGINVGALARDGGGDASGGVVFYKGKGCEYCNGTGYRGRLGVYEIVLFDEELRDAILRKASSGELLRITIRKGTKPLAVDGIAKVKEGLTTLDEIYPILIER